jgi:hypothetical protein
MTYPSELVDHFPLFDKIGGKMFLSLIPAPSKDMSKSAYGLVRQMALSSYQGMTYIVIVP